MKNLVNIGFVVGILISWGKISAQQDALWTVEGVEGKEGTWSLDEVPEDSMRAVAFFAEKVNELQLEGYLEARLAGLNATEHIATIHLGRQYKWIDLEVSTEDELFFGPVLTRIRWDNKPVSNFDLAATSARLLTYAENHGHPFATVQLDSVEIDTGRVSARLAIDKGPLVRIDSLVLKGDAAISQAFIANYLDIAAGDLYNERKVKDIDRKLSGLSFIRLSEAPKIFFSKEGARIVLILEGVNASRFDFVLGVLPGSQTNDGNLLINGQADLSLVNPFGTGKQLSLHWENPKPRSPVLDVNFNFPYLFSSPLGVDYHFDLFKNDTLYLDIAHSLGISWLYGGGNYLKLNFTRRSSNLITIDEEALLATGELPEQLDMVNTMTGLEWQFQNLDYRFNPLRGWLVNLSVAGGLRSVEPNSLIVGLSNESVDFQSQYDSIQASGSIFEGRMDVSKFWQLGRRSTVLTQGRAGYKYARQLFRNDLYFIGGNELIRGFDEASIEASLYSLITVEYRYLIGRNAYLGAFADAAMVERSTRSTYDKTYPVGVGLNLAFETGAGIFAVGYAVGKRDTDQPFELRNGKIHFGYQNYF